MNLRLNRTVLSVVATLVAFAVVASGCGSDGAGDRHAFFEVDDSPIWVDSEFGTDGVAVATRDPNADNRYMNTLSDTLVDPQGRFYRIEQMSLYKNPKGQLRVSRFLPDGSPDTSYGGGDGIAVHDMDSTFTGPYGSMSAAFLDGDGLLLTGSEYFRYPDRKKNTWVVRLVANGDLDGMFGVMGPPGFSGIEGIAKEILPDSFGIEASCSIKDIHGHSEGGSHYLVVAE